MCGSRRDLITGLDRPNHGSRRGRPARRTPVWVDLVAETVRIDAGARLESAPGPPTAHRKPRQARKGATVVESGCGGPLPFYGSWEPQRTSARLWAPQPT